MLEKDWDAPADICIIRELLAVRANQNLASIGLTLLIPGFLDPCSTGGGGTKCPP